ncbi:MAG TPA: toprim domain-containing protein [Oligoflexus sp.]|uniref:toprim domain-containing protein n=1 Tax=Oligoflexus sp. TaxID=1971216 RepID=UPI002D3047FD|nr:toprim domain-containing protein [Oligoflexus sp.]HYX37717.1 toprim domain-containing protein [Oligoflexus sp.]
MSELRDLLDSRYAELFDMAKDCNIDWPASLPFLHGAGTYKSELVPLNKKHKGAQFLALKTWHDSRGCHCCHVYMHTLKQGRIERELTIRPRGIGGTLYSPGTVGMQEPWVKRGLGGIGAKGDPLSSPLRAEGEEAMDGSGHQRELEAQKRHAKERKKRQEKEARKKAQEEIKREADWRRDKAAYEGAPRLDTGFPYLIKKGIANLPEFFDVRAMTAKQQFGKGSDEVFLVHALGDAAGNYVGMKRIWANGEKKLSPGRKEGSYKGAFTVIGNPPCSWRIYVAEGLATAVSIHNATGCAVYIADSAGNLASVAGTAKRQNPGKHVVIVADNDVRTEDKKHQGNTGVFTAMTAAKEHNVRFAIIPALDGEKTDANDYALKRGSDGLREVLTEKVEKPGTGDGWALRMLRVARYDKDGRNGAQKKYIEDFVRATFVGWRTPVADAARFVEAMTGGMVPKDIFTRTASALLKRERAKAERLLEIKGVDHRYGYKVAWDGSGWPMCPPEVLETIKVHARLGHHIILRAPPGTGKTERVINWLMKNAGGPSVVALPRVFVIDDICRRLQIAHYREVTREELRHRGALATCINSLGSRRYKSEEPDGKHWLDGLHFFAMDEVKPLIIQGLRLGDHRTCKANSLQLVRTIQTAKFTLSCDAFADQAVVDAIKKMDHRDIVFIDVAYPEHKRKRLKIHVTDDRAAIRTAFSAALERGETAALSVDSAKEAMRIHRRILRDGVLQPEEILLICGTPRQADLGRVGAFARNPNGEAVKYKAIIYTPKIDAGLSITVPHFKNHFGIFTGVVTVQGQSQMIGRDRTMERTLLFIGDRSTRAAKLKLMADREWIGQPDMFDDLNLLMDESELRSLENYRCLSMNFLSTLGHDVQMLPEAPKDLEQSRDMGSISKKLKEEEIEAIEKAEEIDEDLHKRMKRRDLITDIDQAMIRSYEIRELMCGKIERPTIEFYLRGGDWRLKNMETAASSESDVQWFDEKEGKQHTSKGALFRAEERRSVLLQGMAKLGLDPRNRFQGEFRSDDAMCFLEWALSMASTLNQLFRGIIDPKKPPRCAVQFLKKFLAMFGLYAGKRKSNGRMIRFIEQASLDFVLGLIRERRRRGRELITQFEPDEGVALLMRPAPP